MAKSENAKQRRTVYKVVKSNRMSMRVSDRMALEYLKGTIVEADPESMGIFVFKTRRDAMDQFVESDSHRYKVLRVEPLSDGYTPKMIQAIWLAGSGLGQERTLTTQIQPGTMCYHKVRVLD